MVEYNEREWWIDYAKVIGIFFIVIIHLMANFKGIGISGNKTSTIVTLGFVFHVPLFFFLSGYLYKDILPKYALSKYIKRLIVPFFFFGIIGIIIYTYSTSDLSNIFDIVVSALKYFTALVLQRSSLQNPNGPVWFLLALFWVFIIFSIVQFFIKKDYTLKITENHFLHIKKDYVIVLFLIIFNLILLLSHHFKITLYFSIDSALIGINFFVGGYLFKKHNLIKYFNSLNRNIIYLIISLIVFVGMIFLTWSYFMINNGTIVGNIIFAYINSFIGIFLVITFSSIISKFKNKLIYLISINTLVIMGLEKFLRSYITKFLEPFLIHIPFIFGLLIVTILVLLISVGIAMIINRIYPQLIGNPPKNEFF